MAKKKESESDDEKKKKQQADNEQDTNEETAENEQSQEKQGQSKSQQEEEKTQEKTGSKKPQQAQEPKEVTMNLNPYALFVVGLILGVVIALLLPTGTGDVQDQQNQDNTNDAQKQADTISASEAGSQVKQYVTDNSQAFRLPPSTTITVQNSEQLSGAPLYAVDLQIEAQVQNRTTSQQITAHMTNDGKWLFLQSQPLDTSKPVQEQIQQQAPRQPPQQPPQQPPEPPTGNETS